MKAGRLVGSCDWGPEDHKAEWLRGKVGQKDK